MFEQYKYILVPFISWAAAQLLKFLIEFVRNGNIDFTRLTGTGGMPSGHTALVSSLAAVVGKNYGIKSVEFGISIITALIIMYDATGVRRAAGKQAEILNRIIHHQKDGIHIEERLKELIGHTPFEVFGGGIIGIAVGLIFG